jgi:sugar phosphate isomerase/epimerase
VVKTAKISLGSWAFTFGPFEEDPWPFSKVLKYTSDAGYEGIEINGFRPHPHPEDYDSPSKCSKLKREIADLGLGISGYAPDFHAVPPALVDRQLYLDMIRKCLHFCTACGIRTLRVDTVSPPEAMEEPEFQRCFARLASTWNAAAAECMKEGVLLVWEFEPGFWLNKPEEVKRMAEAVSHENFKLLFDTSHAYMGAVVGARHVGEKTALSGGVVGYAEYLREHIGHFHLIDSDGSLHDDETSTHAPFGRGCIDFKAVFAALRSLLESMEWWCVDFCFCPTTERHAREAVPFIKKIAREIV